MSIFTVDKTKCGGAGECAAVCPVGIIKMDPKTHLPYLVEGGEKTCLNCGHCMAVCRSGALVLASMSLAGCQPLDKDWKIPYEKLAQFLKGRRSIRVYKEETVDRAIIEKIIDAGRYAPSGINRQPVNWAVIYDKAKVRQLSALVIDWMRSLIKDKSPLAEGLRMENIVKRSEEGTDPIARGAPHVIIAYSLKDDMTAPQSCTIALTYLELAAVSQGLGACWAGYVHMAVNMSPDVRKLAGISARTDAYGAMMVGYPKYNYHRIPLRNTPHLIWR